MSDEPGQVIELDACTNPAIDPDKVNHTRPRTVTEPQASLMAQTYLLLSAPTRVRLLSALLEGGEACVCELEQIVDLPATDLTEALQQLRHVGVISSRRTDGRVVYRVADAHIRLLLDAGREHEDHPLEPPHHRL